MCLESCDGSGTFCNWGQRVPDSRVQIVSLLGGWGLVGLDPIVWVCVSHPKSPWMIQNFMLNAFVKFTFIELLVLLLFEFRYTLCLYIVPTMEIKLSLSLNFLCCFLIMPGFHHSVAVLPLPFRRCRYVNSVRIT